MWVQRRCLTVGQVIPYLILYQTTNNLVQAQCVPYPIAAPIGNVTLGNGQVSRGVALSVGSPLQDFSFLPQWPLNNTVVYETNGYCTSPAPSSEAGCTTWRGGQYNFLDSNTRRVAPQDETPVDGTPYPDMEFFTDVLHINKNITLDTFPMGGPLEDWSQQGYHPMMAIGLGDNSTLLNALKAGNYIASRVWSTFYGWTGGDSNTQLDGTFVFGGYDRAKVSGEGHTQDLIDDARCPTRMLVVIDDIVLHFPNGTDVSIVAEKPNGSFDACIVPDYPVLMTLAYDPYMAAFEYYTNVSLTQRSTGLAYFSLLYNDGDEPYRGDMTIDIRDGPAVRVPNSQLVVPEQYIADPNGQLMANYSRSNLVINSLQDVNANDITQLGRQFLSSAYVMLNQDSGKFTLWSANPTGVEDLVAVDEKGQDATDWCEASTAPTPGAGALDGAGASQVGKSSSNGADAQVSPGAIAGAVVGGVAFLAFVIGGLLLYRRGRAKANAVARSAPSIDTPAYRNTMSYQGGASSYIHKSVSEMGDGNINRGPNELDGVTIDQLSQTARTERRYELG